MSGFVIDASVVVGLFVKESHSAECIKFFDKLSEVDTHFLAPDALYYEVAATLRKLELRGLFDSVDSALNQTFAFGLSITASKDLMQDAARISRENLISPYDSFYLALARRESVPLITADERLVGGTQGKGFDVRSIANVD